MRQLAIVLAVLSAAAAARANPVEDGTRITLFAGGRYVPHTHFKQLAEASGFPVISDSPLGPQAMLSFAYAPFPTVEVSIELGYAMDSYGFSGTTMHVNSVPIVGTVRYMPIEGRFYPYLLGGAGYLLGFVSGAPQTESETHAQEFHLGAGLSYDLSPGYVLSLEDRYQLAAGDIVPIGQIQTGGNALMLGLSFVLDPVRSIAPHAPTDLR